MALQSDVLRFTLFFHLGRSGWSETYYYNSPISIDAALVPGKLLVSGRMALCSDAVTCDALRVSRTGLPRAAILDESVADTRGVKGEEGARDVRAVALLCTASSGDRKYRHPVYLRGLPDAWLAFNVNEKFNPPAALNGPFRDLAQALGGDSPFCMRVISKEAGDNDERPITAVARHSTGNMLLTVPGHNIVARKEPVRIRKATFNVAGVVGINGVSQAVGPPALGLEAGQVLLIGVPVTSDQAASYQGDGLLATRRTTFVNIQHFDRQRATVHATGRPLSEGRGRRRR